MQAGERPGEAADRIGDDGMAERGVALAVLVGVDDDRPDLRGEPVEHVLDHRASFQHHEALVDAAHATPEAAGQHDAGDVRARKGGRVGGIRHRRGSARRR